MECGLTLPEAVEHSPAQLKLLRGAAKRLKADAALTVMNTTLAAVAYAFSGQKKSFEALRKQFLKDIDT